MQAVAEKMGFKCDTATMSADFGRYYGTTDRASMSPPTVRTTSR